MYEALSSWLLYRIKNMTFNRDAANISNFLRLHVVEAFHKFHTVSFTQKCQSCSAGVRLVANDDAEQWQCPICGAGLPYAFWKVNRDPYFIKHTDDNLLVEYLASDYCHICGESLSRGSNDASALCRCERIHMAEIDDKIRMIYSEMSTEGENVQESLKLIAELNDDRNKIRTREWIHKQLDLLHGDE
jgi:hypothetical protein